MWGLLWERNSCAKQTFQQHQNQSRIRCAPTKAVPKTSGVSTALLWERNSCAKQTIQQHQAPIAHKMRSHKSCAQNRQRSDRSTVGAQLLRETNLPATPNHNRA